LGGFAASLGGAAPTGLIGVDVVYITGAGALFVIAASRGGRNSWMLSSLLAVWFSPDLAGLVGIGITVGLVAFALLTERRRWIGAMCGAILAWYLGRLGTGPFHSSTTLAAAAVAVPIVGSGLRHLPDGRPKVIGRLVGVLFGAAALASAVFAVVALLALGDVNRGVDHAEAGFQLASDGVQADAAREFERSAEAFRSVQSKVGGPWSLPARLVPIVGQHVRAVQVVASEGVSLSGTAAETTLAVDLDDVRLVEGRIDLGIIDDLAPVLSRAEQSVSRAHLRIGDVQNPWLISPINTRLGELVTELDRALPAARTAAQAAREAPAMLGATEPVHWLVLLTTPAEARGIGGLVGNFVVIRADDGRFEIVDAGRNEDLNHRLADAGAELRGPEQYVDRWADYEPNAFFQDVGLEPDLPSVAAVAAGLYEQASRVGEAEAIEISGVVVLDPYAMAAILDLSGPVSAGEIRLSSDTVVDFLLVDQYDRFEGNDLARVAALGQLVTGAFDAFTGSALPGPRGIAAKIGPIIDADRLGVWWAGGGGPAALIDTVGLDGAFPSPAGRDLIALVHQNSGQNKLDVYLERSLDYAVVIDDGRASATATITLENRAPNAGLPLSVIGSNDQGYPLGTNVSLFSVHTALDLVSVRIDGVEVPAERDAAFGGDAITFTVEIPSMTTVVVELDLAGRLEIDGLDDYELVLPHQPLVNTDLVSVEVTVDGETATLADQMMLAADAYLSTR
jgi:hypothetical protein